MSVRKICGTPISVPKRFTTARTAVAFFPRASYYGSCKCGALSRDLITYHDRPSDAGKSFAVSILTRSIGPFRAPRRSMRCACPLFFCSPTHRTRNTPPSQLNPTPFRCLFKDLGMGMSKGNVQMVNVYNFG